MPSVDELQRLVGRLLVVGVRGARPDNPAMKADLETCTAAHVGGVMLFDRDLPTGNPRNIESPTQLAELTSCLRETLGPDLLVMIDQEGGAVARLREEHGFDSGVSAHTFANMDEAEQRGIARVQAEQLRSCGVNVNLAPVVDLAIEPGSRIIAGLERSFGASVERVIACARVWIEEHRAAGVASCLKHYPGHGSARGDTHDGLVEITSRGTADDELAPYLALACEPGVMVMTGHLLDRSIDHALPASLSAAHTDGVLRERIGFQGVIVTDSIDMGAVRDRWAAPEAVVLAIQAGSDLVVDAVNSPGPSRPSPAMKMSDALTYAIESGQIRNGIERLQASAERIRLLRGSIAEG